MKKDKYGLTPRERDIYNYIVAFKLINGFSPTLYEIADELLTSRTFVRESVQKLNEKGIIQYNPKKRRTITVKKMIV